MVRSGTMELEREEKESMTRVEGCGGIEYGMPVQTSTSYMTSV